MVEHRAEQLGGRTDPRSACLLRSERSNPDFDSLHDRAGVRYGLGLLENPRVLPGTDAKADVLSDLVGRDLPVAQPAQKRRQVALERLVVLSRRPKHGGRGGARAQHRGLVQQRVVRVGQDAEGSGVLVERHHQATLEWNMPLVPVLLGVLNVRVGNAGLHEPRELHELLAIPDDGLIVEGPQRLREHGAVELAVLDKEALRPGVTSEDRRQELQREQRLAGTGAAHDEQRLSAAGRTLAAALIPDLQPGKEHRQVLVVGKERGQVVRGEREVDAPLGRLGAGLNQTDVDRCVQVVLAVPGDQGLAPERERDGALDAFVEFEVVHDPLDFRDAVHRFV